MNQDFEFIGLGYCSNDYLCRVSEIPLDHKVEALEHLTQGGGPAATASVAAARLGMRTAFLGVAGDDESGRTIVKDLNAEQVSTVAFQIRKGCTTSTAFCWVDNSGKRSIVWYRGNGPDLTDAEVPEAMIAKAKILHLDGHQTKAALTAAKMARRHGVIVNIDAGTLRPGVEEILKHTDILITSEFFAKQLTGLDGYEKQLMELVKIGAKVTGITMGCKGSMCYDRETGKIITCPIFADCKVIDTTGAGDVFHAAFGVKYVTCKDLYECMRFASAVSGIKCGKLGGRAGIPTLSEVEIFLKNHQ